MLPSLDFSYPHSPGSTRHAEPLPSEMSSSDLLYLGTRPQWSTQLSGAPKRPACLKAAMWYQDWYIPFKAGKKIQFQCVWLRPRQKRIPCSKATWSIRLPQIKYPRFMIKIQTIWSLNITKPQRHYFPNNGLTTIPAWTLHNVVLAYHCYFVVFGTLHAVHIYRADRQKLFVYSMGKLLWEDL